ncbi:MAG: DNA polymerase III subunit alpha [Chloroflexi bacterium]|nr:DNA polymerase III subunit alpha [Chloroflexota bacterium]
MSADAHERAARARFVHLDVLTAYSPWCSPSTPEDYVRTLARQHPLGPDTDEQPRPAIAIADYGLHSVVKTAVACDRNGVDHIVGLRVRVVPERAFRTWGERVGELILLAIDETGWLSLVGLNNCGYLAGADRGRPRVDWQDLERYRDGVIALTGMPGGGGMLSSAIERAANPVEPFESFGVVRRLMDLYPGRLYLELAYHGNPAERLVNRGLVAIAQRMELPLVATGGVRFAHPDDALAHKVLEAIGRGTRADGVLGYPGRDGLDLPTLTVEATRAQAYLKSARQMWRTFGQMPAALQASIEIAERCQFRLPLARRKRLGEPSSRLGPELLFGLAPAREVGEQQLAELVDERLPARFAETGRGEPSADVLERASQEVQTICSSGLADLLLFAHDVGRFCAQRGFPVAARGSATSSLVVWALGLSDLCPLEYDLDGRMFTHDGRQDLPDLDLEISSLHEAAVSAFIQQGGFAGLPEHEAGEFPNLRAVRVGVHVSMGARQAVRAVGAALGMQAPRVNSVARQVPLLSSPGAIESVITRAPELGIADAGAGVEPYNTLVRVAGRLEGLPHRYGAHPSAYTFSFYGPSALAWLPAQWVSDGRPGRRRVFGTARHLAMVPDERAQAAGLAHQTALPANFQAATPPVDELDEDAAVVDVGDAGSPVLALQLTKDDLESLGLVRLDISPSSAMATASRDAADASEPDPATIAAAWRLLEAGDTLCISQVESVGFRMLLKRAHELASSRSQEGQALRSLEDLAQLLALWKPGVYGQDAEQTYFDHRFAARTRPTYPHPAMGTVLDATAGLVLYADQLVQLVKLLGFDHAWAERFRRALSGGRLAGRDLMERAIREAGARHQWTTEQSNALLSLLLRHVGYLHLHGHALTTAQHAFRQACQKVNPSTSARFFADVLNNGGSAQYGLGSAVEEARRFGVLLLPPCVNASSDRFAVEDSNLALLEAQQKGRGTVGAVRVPLTAIRGMGPDAAQHILGVRTAFGSYTSLLDFCRKVDRRIVSRHDLVLLIKLGAFGFTALPRALLMAAEQYYSSLADLLRFGEPDPTGLATLEDDLSSGAIKYLHAAEWSPELVAAYELAHLGFVTASPLEVQKHADRLVEEFGVVNIAELVDFPDKAPASVGAIITNLRLRTTRKGEKMAWLTFADATGAIEAAVFPNAYQQIAESNTSESPLREGAFVVARGRLAHEEATGSKLFVDDVLLQGGRASHLSALAIAIQEQAPDEWSALGA